MLQFFLVAIPSTHKVGFRVKTLRAVEAIRSFVFAETPTSVVDPDPHGSALILVGWIRIQTSRNDQQK
jgi:hypothetical protein